MVAKTDGLVKTLAALKFEGNAFLSAMLLDDLGRDACSFDHWGTKSCVLTIVHEENLAELDFVVSFHGELVDTEGVAFLHAVLFTAGFENCVGHGWVSAKS